MEQDIQTIGLMVLLMVDKILLELLRQVTQEGRGWGLRWGWGWLWGAATRSSPLGVYFADFLRPDSFFFFNLFYPHTVELASVSFGAFLFNRHFHSGDIKIWSRKMFTLLKRHLYSGERDTFSGSRNLGLIPSQRTPNNSNQKVTDHKNIICR